MKLKELEDKLREILPDCSISCDFDDQLTIYTDLYLDPDTDELKKDDREYEFFFVRARTEPSPFTTQDNETPKETTEETSG